jgi:hypothetical protein
MLFNGDQFFGVSLGDSIGDVSIDGIKRVFGLMSSEVGIDARKVRQSPKELRLHIFKDGGALILDGQSFGDTFTSMEDVCSKYYVSLKNEVFSCAWDEKSFGIFVKGRKHLSKLEQLHSALVNSKAAIFLGSGRFIGKGSGLAIIDLEAAPIYISQNIYQYDMELAECEAAIRESNIKNILIDAKKDIDNIAAAKINGQVKFWVDPTDKLKYQSGWYSMEDLVLWSRDSGPIIKRKQ